MRGQRALGSAPSSGNEYIFVSNDTEFGRGDAAEIDYWPVGTNGNVAPTVIWRLEQRHFSYGLEGIVVDNSREILVNRATPAHPRVPAEFDRQRQSVDQHQRRKHDARPAYRLAIDDSDNLYVADCGSGSATARTVRRASTYSGPEVTATLRPCAALSATAPG